MLHIKKKTKIYNIFSDSYMSLVLILVLITFHLYSFVQDLLLRLSYFEFRTHQLFLNQQYSTKIIVFFFFSIFSSWDINETRRFNVIEKRKHHSLNHIQKKEFLSLLLLVARLIHFVNKKII